MPPLLVMGALTAGSAVAGGLANRSKKTTSSSTTTPTWTPQQMEIQNLLAGQLKDGLANPTSLDPLKTAAISSTNKTFDGVSKRMQSTMAGRGFGSSGKVVANQREIETARAGEIGQTESTFAGLEIDQKNRLLQMMQQFGFMSPGQNSTGEQILPGNVAGGALSSGVETATLLYMLDKLGKSKW
jgi:hypothetical protein